MWFEAHGWIDAEYLMNTVGRLDIVGNRHNILFGHHTEELKFAPYITTFETVLTRVVRYARSRIIYKHIKLAIRESCRNFRNSLTKRRIESG